MKKTFTILGLMLLTFNLLSQNSYVVEYDKPKDKFTYKKIEYTFNGGKLEIPLKGKLPKLNKGDNVVIEVTNYNPFLYYVVIEDEPKIVQSGKKSNAFGLLSMVSGGLAPISSFMSGLSTTQSDFKSTRGELAKNENELELYSNESKQLADLMKNYQEKYTVYQKTLEEILKEDLKAEVQSIIGKLKEIYKNFYDPTDKIALLSSTSRLHYFKAGVLDSKIQENANSLDYQLIKFKELLASPSNSYNKKGIQEWITKLETADFSLKKSHMISNEIKSFTIGSTESEMEQEALVGMDYKIKFYRLKDLQEAIEKVDPNKAPTHVKYYFSNKFWNADGKIVDTLCENCTPVLRAEGLYDDSENEVPRNYEQIFEGGNTDGGLLVNEAVGKWTFYNQNGELSHILLGPETESYSTNKKSSKNEYDPDEISNMYSIVKSVEIPIKGAIIMNWASGLYSISSFKQRSNYYTIDNATGDSSTVQQSTLSRSKICIGSQMAFDFAGNKLITPTLNLGAAVDFWDDRDIHFLVGGGLKFKKFPFMSLTAGVAFTQVNVLNKSLQVGQAYDNSNTSLELPNIQTKKYVPGYFVGLNINF